MCSTNTDIPAYAAFCNTAMLGFHWKEKTLHSKVAPGMSLLHNFSLITILFSQDISKQVFILSIDRIENFTIVFLNARRNMPGAAL